MPPTARRWSLTATPPPAGALRSTSAMIRAALRGGDPFAALDAALDRHCRPSRNRFADMLAPAWRHRGHDAPERHRLDVPRPSRLGSANSPHDSKEALTVAIELGGDTDTVGAVTGGLAGALHGISNPQPLDDLPSWTPDDA